MTRVSTTFAPRCVCVCVYDVCVFVWVWVWVGGWVGGWVWVGGCSAFCGVERLVQHDPGADVCVGVGVGVGVGVCVCVGGALFCGVERLVQHDPGADERTINTPPEAHHPLLPAAQRHTF